jgi:hypothetical protein
MYFKKHNKLKLMPNKQLLRTFEVLLCAISTLNSPHQLSSS